MNGPKTYKLDDRVTVTRDSIDVQRFGLPKFAGKTGTVTYAYSGDDACNVRIDGETQDTFLRNTDLKLAETAPKETTVTNLTPTTATSDTFNLAATKALVKVAKAKKNFTTDDIWASLPAGSANGLDPRVLGGFMVEAAKGGYIVATGRYKPSKRVECHKRPVRVWKSLIFASK